MRKLLFLWMILLLALTACGRDEGDYTLPEPSGQITVGDTHNSTAPRPPVPSATEDLLPVTEEDHASVPRGGNLAVYEKRIAFLPQEGGVALADRQSGAFAMLTDQGAWEVWLDDKGVYFTCSDGIYGMTGGGQLTCFSEEISHALWPMGDKLYYVRQTDLSRETPSGELWAMDQTGGGKVAILKEEVEGDFCIRGGWVYYIAKTDGSLCRSMLYGDQQARLAQNVSEILLCTDRAVYYTDRQPERMLRRVDLRTGANVALGAYGQCVQGKEQVYALVRRAHDGVTENQFSLIAFDERTLEQENRMTFENIGADRLVWADGERVFLHQEEGALYAIDCADPAQQKQILLHSVTGICGSMAFADGGDELAVYDCITGELEHLVKK